MYKHQCGGYFINVHSESNKEGSSVAGPDKKICIQSLAHPRTPPISNQVSLISIRNIDISS